MEMAAETGSTEAGDGHGMGGPGAGDGPRTGGLGAGDGHGTCGPGAGRTGRVTDSLGAGL